MGKRSTFERRERDFYPTPAAAVHPLLHHLPKDSSFVEPRAGDGALVRHLEAAGHRCALAYDVEPQSPEIGKGDAVSLVMRSDRGVSADLIITNPPWTRPVLHEMIQEFSRCLPTWLLFDADWVHTKQAAPYLPSLRKVVSVGRIKWLPGSPYTGKDNCAWHLFDQHADGPATFHGRAI